MFLLKDYTPSLYNIQHTQLSFLLNLNETVVRSQLLCEATPDALHGLDHSQQLQLPEFSLHGEDLELLEIQIAAYGEDHQNWKNWATLAKLEEYQLLTEPTKLDEFLGFNHPNFLTLKKDVDFILENNLLKIQPHILKQYISDKNSQFILQIHNKIKPINNKTLSGMYASNGKIFTQCEAEGFRRITYYLDRPDQMNIFTVHITVTADQNLPILLSNGNLLAEWMADTDTQQKHVIWHDPFKKPSYLFALVAGDLHCHERIITQNGKEKLLQIWVEETDIGKTEHAMNSLEKSICWDEEVYGLPLDLDRFMIVATHDFNMGAMENKGLNIFNAKYILAHPDMATDVDYYNVESIIAHEYFHNWTGNRITCRDWFQLTLKEGLTVFRDQSFSEDLQGAVTRLEGIQFLKQTQFAEDRGPMAHPIQPQEYEEINNFYTLTVYEKGAEIIRMYQTLLGKAGFMAGMKLYFQRHDGQAVTCQDFFATMFDANPDTLSLNQQKHFANWYTQKGTPIITCQHNFDREKQQLKINITQSIQAINQQMVEFFAPLLIPVAVDIYLKMENADYIKIPHQTLKELTASKNIRNIDERLLLLSDEFLQNWQFDLKKLNELSADQNITDIQVVYLQDFSAPVLLENTCQISPEFILKYETNLYQKQQAFIALELQALLAFYQDHDNRFDEALEIYIDALLDLLDSKTKYIGDDFKAVVLNGLDFAEFKAELIRQNSEKFNPQSAWLAFYDFKHKWVGAIVEKIEASARYQKQQLLTNPQYDFKDINQRSLAYAYLKIMTYSFDFTQQKNHAERLKELYSNAQHLSQRLAALQNMLLLQNIQNIQNIKNLENLQPSPVLGESLNTLYTTFKQEPLIIDQWFKLQAMQYHVDSEKTVANIRQLMQHADFSDTPNRVRALLLTFFTQNIAFYSEAGLELWVETVLKYDNQNPQLAARFARSLDDWTNFSDDLQALIKPKLEELVQKATSSDVLEVVKRALGVLG